MKTKEPIYAVVIGLSTNGLANVRALCQHGVPVIIFLSQEQSQEVYAATRYGQKHLVKVGNGAAIIQHLHDLSREATYILFPTGDSQVSYLSDHRADLPSHCILPFPEDRVVKMLLDKQPFDKFCRTHAFPVPKTTLVQKHEDIQQSYQNMTFPIIAKTPMKVYKEGLGKAYILSDKDELQRWYDSVQSIHQEFVLQEYIPGTDHSVFFTMQYISATGKLLASFTGRKIRQFPPLKGGTASAEPAYSEFLTDFTYQFFRKAKFWGIGSMEYKLDGRTGTFYMVEPTVGRTDFQEGVAIANGVNIPLVAYQDIVGLAVQPVFQKRNAHKVWMHVLYDRLARDWYMSQKELTYVEWLASLRHVRAFDAFSLRDPGPALLSLQKKILNRLQTRGSKRV
jgi:D-aspartate ligase